MRRSHKIGREQVRMYEGVWRKERERGKRCNYIIILKSKRNNFKDALGEEFIHM